MPRKVPRQLEGGHAVRELGLAADLLELDRGDRAGDVRPVDSCARRRLRRRARRSARSERRARRRDRCSSRRGRRAGASGRRCRSRPARRPPPASAGSSPSSALRRPAPEPRRADAGVDEDGRAAGAKQVRGAGMPPLRAGEQLRIERSCTAPSRRSPGRARPAPRAGRPRRRAGRARPTRLPTRAHASPHGRMRGGAGSPCASCHDTTGLRSTPIRSISASITSPGFR